MRTSCRPGNRYVTAAKQLVGAHVAIDMLAGSFGAGGLRRRERSPAIIAADLLARRSMTRCGARAGNTRSTHPVRVDSEHRAPACRSANREVARCGTRERRRSCCADLGGGHSLRANATRARASELCLQDAAAVAPRLSTLALLCSSGSVRGRGSGDYGAGPNHVLPTAGTAWSKGGLSVIFAGCAPGCASSDSAAARPAHRDAAVGSVESRGSKRTLVPPNGGGLSVRSDCDTFQGSLLGAPIGRPSLPYCSLFSFFHNTSRHSAPRSAGPTRAVTWGGESPQTARREAGAICFQEGRQRRGRPPARCSPP